MCNLCNVTSWLIMMFFMSLGSLCVFFQQSRNMQIKSVGYSNLPIGVNVCALISGLSLCWPCDGVATCPGCNSPLSQSQLVLASASAGNR